MRTVDDVAYGVLDGNGPAAGRNQCQQLVAVEDHVQHVLGVLPNAHTDWISREHSVAFSMQYHAPYAPPDAGRIEPQYPLAAARRRASATL